MPSRKPAPEPTPPPHDPDAVRHLRRNTFSDNSTGCRFWAGAKGDHGYGSTVYRDKRWLTHRLSWYAHFGPIPNGHFVCHACDNRACIAIEHLFLGTPQENVNDMLAKGRGHWKSRLKEEQVIAIKQRLASGESVSPIAKHYGVTYATILAIKSGRNWRHIQPIPDNRARQQPGVSYIPILEFPHEAG